MSNQKHINIGDDPFKDLHLEDVSLEEQYTQLDDHSKVLLFCKIHNYSFIPPTPERMYQDDYYLGNEHFFGKGGSSLFQFWKDTYKKIFPEGEFGSVLTTTPFLAYLGSIGYGKSSSARYCLAMTYARLLAMRNPSQTLGLAPKPLTAIILHRQEETAQVEFEKWFKYDLMNYSPFFRNTKNDNLKFSILTGGPRSGTGIGRDLVYICTSEVSFWPNQEQAKEKLATLLIRFKSRLSLEAMQKVGFFIIDSSAKGQTDSAEWFLDNVDNRYLTKTSPAHYQVRTDMYKQSEGKTFKVYVGSASKPAQILPADYKKGDLDIDEDLIEEVPIQLLGEYKANLIKSIQDFSGISTTSSDLFFPEGIEHMLNCSKLFLNNNRIPEIITVDFYNKEERLIQKIRPALSLVAFQTPLWVGLDLSAAKGGDYTGISICSFEGWKIVGGVKMPQIKCWVCVAIRNKEGQEISLFHIYQLLQDLNRDYFITVSADQAFSRQILQDCDRDGIKNVGRISTDIVPCEPAIYLKNLINNELIELPFNKRLQREAADLRYTPKGKIDHPAKATISKEFDNPDGKQKGSKDCWDSLAQACYAMKLSLDEGNEQGWSGSVSRSMQALDGLTKSSREEAQKVFQDMINNIF